MIFFEILWIYFTLSSDMKFSVCSTKRNKMKEVDITKLNYYWTRIFGKISINFSVITNAREGYDRKFESHEIHRFWSFYRHLTEPNHMHPSSNYLIVRFLGLSPNAIKYCSTVNRVATSLAPLTLKLSDILRIRFSPVLEKRK